MSSLTVATLSDGTNSTSSTNAIRGSARAWVRWSLATSPGTIASSYNVTSVTKNGTGNCTINFTNALTDSNYTIVGTAAQPGVSSGNLTFNGVPSSSSSVGILMYNSNFSAFQDSTVACVTIFR